MFGAGRDGLHLRGVLAVAAVSLFLLVGVLAFGLMSGSPSLPPASNVAAECAAAATGPTARGYGETGAAVAGAECDSSSQRIEREQRSTQRRPPVSPAPRPSRDGGAGDRPGRSGHPCPYDQRLPHQSGRPNAREDDETGHGGDTAAAACYRCPSDSRATGSADGDGASGDDSSAGGELSELDRSSRERDSVGPTGRGYGESGASGVMDSVPDDRECPSAGARGAKAPTTGGGGAHDGRVPGATGRPAPTRTTAAEDSASGPLRDPLVAASVGQTTGDDRGRKNTAVVVGGLVLLLVAVAVVLRRGRPGPSR